MKVSQQILDLIPYKPGKPIEETQQEFNLDKVYKLASNENPLGVSERVQKALNIAVKQIHRYPDASSGRTIEAISQHYSVPTEKIVLTNGSNEAIDLLIRLYCEPGDKILTSEAAFIAYKICAQAARVDCIETPLNKDLSFDLTDLKAQAEKHKPKLIFIANPNNPTGTYVNREDLRAFLEESKSWTETLVVLDEAYCEFVRAPDCPNALEFFNDFPNLVITRTLSKVYGIAGLRIGFVFGPAETIELLNRIRNPFNVNSLAQAACIAALGDHEYVKRAQEVTWQGLDYFYSEFDRMAVKYWESQANFVLLELSKGIDEVYQELLRQGIILRPVKGYGLRQHLRLSVGLPEENQKAIFGLDQVLSK